MKSKKQGFTLIELLTVIAIIGILAAIIIPTVGSVKVSANKAKTKVLFGQWASAIGMFKQDYGFYPYFGATAPTVDSAVNLSTTIPSQMFVEVLTGKKPNGDPITGDSLSQNKRRASYYSFSNAELTANGPTVTSIVDAFNNDEIILMIDYNYDGLVTTASPPSVRAGNTSEGYGTARALLPSVYTDSTGVRAGVVFYSAGKGDGSNDIVTSW